MRLITWWTEEASSRHPPESQWTMHALVRTLALSMESCKAVRILRMDSRLEALKIMPPSLFTTCHDTTNVAGVEAGTKHQAHSATALEAGVCSSCLGTLGAAFAFTAVAAAGVRDALPPLSPVVLRDCLTCGTASAFQAALSPASSGKVVLGDSLICAGRSLLIGFSSSSALDCTSFESFGAGAGMALETSPWIFASFLAAAVPIAA
ncbi:unnamed protein product [Durusdinium trenchii]|uniref:Uncharacterized protein n=1 Tax=Durusdinium trenchii TaxID=1381693 RepID=A0ABP0KSS1_9DINO